MINILKKMVLIEGILKKKTIRIGKVVSHLNHIVLNSMKISKKNVEYTGNVNVEFVD